MFSFGIINEQTGSQRNSVLIVMSFFVVGLLLLYFTRPAQKKEEKLVNG
jgi:UMF1 family MFS transporter